jgi:hypothetical protein
MLKFNEFEQLSVPAQIEAAVQLGPQFVQLRASVASQVIWALVEVQMEIGSENEDVILASA